LVFRIDRFGRKRRIKRPEEGDSFKETGRYENWRQRDKENKANREEKNG
jgi:hypothetical protein